MNKNNAGYKGMVWVWYGMSPIRKIMKLFGPDKILSIDLRVQLMRH